jgi:hypothetical protein
MTASDSYPSLAATYGTDQLITMGGSLAEQAEAKVGDTGEGGLASLTLAQIATAYAGLAQASALREIADELTDMATNVEGLANDVERIRACVEEVAHDAEGH